MPQITKVTLHSFSSQDPNFPAKNLLETRVTKKWKCEKAGEKNAFIVLKLDKPYKITQIDVGNEFSALIEILVANSQQDPPNFQEIVLATSVMTIIDSKSEKNPNRVRMFNHEIFIPAIAEQKWDLIKVVCTQNFNLHKQFGLAFINLHTNEEVKDDDSPIRPVKISLPPKPADKTPRNSTKPLQKIGKFRFRDSSSDDNEEDTSPFAQWKNKKSNTPSTTDTTKSSIKEQLKAKLDSENKRKRVSDDDEEKKQPKVKQDRNRSRGLFYDSSDDEPNEKLQKKIEKDKELHKTKEHNSSRNSIKSTPTTPSSNKFSSFLNDDKIATSSTSSPKSSNAKRDDNNKPTTLKKPIDKEIKYKPFDRLLQGVVFVISGYQNPERGIIRQKAIDLGAKYKADWDNSCTHLICAYSNTPKYNQVKGNGKIVSKKWIENCFIEQKMIPWRRYALDNSEKNKPESEDEIHCEWNEQKSTSDKKEQGGSKKVVSEDSDDDMLVIDRRVKNNIKIVIDSNSDGDMAVVNKTNKKDDVIKSKQDDDECSVNPQDSNNNKNNDSNAPQSIIDYSEDSVSSIDITTVECQAFKDKHFYLNEDLSATDIIKLKDNIKNMLGIVTKNSHKANYIITKHGKKLPVNVKGEVVKEIWIRECFELQAFIPTTRYKLSQ